jgi:hypothetical protein
MYAFWMNGHSEHRAAGYAVVGIDTGPTQTRPSLTTTPRSRVLRDVTMPT